MKKMLKRLFAGGLALTIAAMTAFVAAPVFAATDNISLTMPTTATLVITKYVLSNLQAATFTGTGSVNDAAKAAATGGTLLDGITFKIYPVKVPGTNSSLNPTSSDSPAPGQINPDPQTYPSSGVTTDPISFTDSKGYVFTVGSSAGSETTADNSAAANGSYGDGTAVFSNIPAGTYLVVEQANPLVATPCAPFVVSVPMANPNGPGYLATVYVYPKNEDLTLQKTVDSGAVTVGSPVVYNLESQVPNNITDTIKYYVSDPLDTALTPQSVQVVAYDTKADADAAIVAMSAGTLSPGTPGTGGVTVPASEYTLTPTMPGPAGATVKVDFITTTNSSGVNSQGIAQPLKAGATLISGKYQYVVITLNSVVNANILTKTTVSNQATLTYTDPYNETKTIPSTNPNDNNNPDTNIHVAQINLLKYDAASTAPVVGGANTTTTFLSGASYEIFSSSTAVTNNKPIMIATSDGTASGTIIGVWDSGNVATEPALPAGATKATTNVPAGQSPNGWIPWVVTTDNNGSAIFNGVADYSGSQTPADYYSTQGITTPNNQFPNYLSYYLLETQAPKGYNINTTPVQVKFNDSTSNTITAPATAPTYTANISVSDSQGFSLPKTGAIGSVIFVVGGVALVGLAALIVIATKKKKGTSNDAQ
jgi:fimbrial isopeptide formation D2 family protein/LPXTG-motif cell wall-anchored protein